jgi:hypothetical protein
MAIIVQGMLFFDFLRFAWTVSNLQRIAVEANCAFDSDYSEWRFTVAFDFSNMVSSAVERQKVKNLHHAVNYSHSQLS